MRLSCTINGEPREVDGLWEGESLLYVLRERLSLPGSKNACEQGECGSCSVYLDGSLVCSCLVAAGQAEGRDVVTVEGLAPEEELHPIQNAFLEAGAVQCGFCTPGLIVATHDLLARNASPIRRRDPRGAGRQPVPLHGLREDPRRGPAGGLVILEGCAVATVSGAVYPDGHVVIEGNRITAVGPGPARGGEGPRVDASGCLATPGLVNCHHHLYQWATRGHAQQATLFEWLVELYPTWARIDAACWRLPRGPGSPRCCARAARRRPITTTCSRTPTCWRSRSRSRASRDPLSPVPRRDGLGRLGGRAPAGQHRRGP